MSRAHLVSCLLLAVPTGCGEDPLLHETLAQDSTDACVGVDSTAAVQSAMGIGACLPAGTYVVDVPALNASGRRPDSMLLCGSLMSVALVNSLEGCPYVGARDP